jgi:hypothetical protein
MIDFSLSLIENGDSIVVYATAGPDGSLGQSRRILGHKEIAELERIQCKVEALSQSCLPEDETGRDLDTPTIGRLALGTMNENLVDLGKQLFGLIFQEGVNDLYVVARASVEGVGEDFLLVLLKLAPDSSLQEIPWEILYDGFCYLAKASRTVLVRFFEQLPAVSRLEVEPPLRILLTTANPPDLPSLALAEEEAAIRLAYQEAGSLVRLVVKRDVSLKELKDLWLEAKSMGEPFHVWHHCGHGGQKIVNQKKEFVLWLEESGNSEPVTIEQVQEVVGLCPELRIAVFNVCRGGSITGIVPALAKINVPVVIGFHYSVHDTSACNFARALHKCLLKLPVELALSSARKYIRVDGPRVSDWSHALAFSRRRDRGTLLRKPAAKATKKRRSRAVIAMTTGAIKGNGNIVDIDQSVTKKDSRRAPNARMATGDVDGSGNRQAVTQNVNDD